MYNDHIYKYVTRRTRNVVFTQSFRIILFGVFCFKHRFERNAKTNQKNVSVLIYWKYEVLFYRTEISDLNLMILILDLNKNALRARDGGRARGTSIKTFLCIRTRAL